MGASTCWLAIKGKSRAKILEELGLRLADSKQEGQGAKMIGSDFPNGWYIIAAGGYGNSIIDDENLRPLSTGCEIVAGGAESHVMCSTACGWMNGREAWWMDHNSEVDVENLSTRGELPPEFASIREKLLADQEAEGGPDCGVDFMFSAPEILTKSITGYSYETSEPGEVWDSLLPARPKKSLFGRLFGS